MVSTPGMLGAVAVLVIGMAACAPTDAGDGPYASNAAGLDRRNLDESISPCVDFYQYANGGWLALNPVPSDRPRMDVWAEVQERNFEVLHEILDEASEAARYGEGDALQQQVGAYFAGAMDEGRLTELGAGPLDDELSRIDAIGSVADLHDVLIDRHAEGQLDLFGVFTENDAEDAGTTMLYVLQGGLGLPEKDYYFRDRDAETRRAYEAHIARMLGFLGADDASASAGAATVMAMETELAEASLGAVALRDPSNIYRPVTAAEATALTPNLPWDRYLAGIGVDTDRFSFPHTGFFSRLNEMLEERPIDDWKTYLRWHTISGSAGYLSPEIQDEDFDFYRRTLQGTAEREEVWKRSLRATDNSLGQPLGRLYVERVFPPETKERADRMIEDLREALRRRIEGLEWMGDDTRARALDKLASFRPKIGYPDEWRDYEAVDVAPDDHFGNTRRAQAFEARRAFDQVGQAPDPNEFGMSPPTVNAYYNPLKNEIVFPAGILQPPFFDGEADDAVNYGAMGAVIGHEMGHGFDDQGSRFDADGLLADWWTAADRAEFTRRAAVVVEQYGAYEPLDGLFVNGELTLGENIGDIGGLMFAYDALQMALERSPVGEIDGLTPDQRFFLSWAQAWRRNQTEEALRVQVSTDPHSPAHYRANGPVSNMPQFAAAFSCQAGDPMVRPDSILVAIW